LGRIIRISKQRFNHPWRKTITNKKSRVISDLERITIWTEYRNQRKFNSCYHGDPRNAHLVAADALPYVNADAWRETTAMTSRSVHHSKLTLVTQAGKTVHVVVMLTLASWQHCSVGRGGKPALRTRRRHLVIRQRHTADKRRNNAAEICISMP